jgi:drug/metabolite transporter (DMT)-like permease
MPTFIFRAIMAVSFYSVANYYLDKHLSKYSGFIVLIIWDIVMLGCSLFSYSYFKFTGEKIVTPVTYQEYLVVAGIGIIYYFADMFYINAFHDKSSSVIIITSIIVALPIMVGVMKIVIDREYPTLGQCIGCAFVIAGILIYTYTTPSKPDQPEELQNVTDVETKVSASFFI